MFDFEDDDTVLGEAWEPTEEQFDAYRKRELELAKANCQFLEREYGMRAVRAANTLHTKHAIRDAERPKDPARVAMGSFMLGYQALLAERPR